MKLFLILLFSGILLAAVDINNANIKELSTLKGIGKIKAKAIASYREKHCFKTKQDIIKVKGIGKKIFEKNKDDIEAGECKER